MMSGWPRMQGAAVYRTQSDGYDLATALMLVLVSISMSICRCRFLTLCLATVATCRNYHHPPPTTHHPPLTTHSRRGGNCAASRLDVGDCPSFRNPPHTSAIFPPETAMYALPVAQSHFGLVGSKVSLMQTSSHLLFPASKVRAQYSPPRDSALMRLWRATAIN